MVETNIEQKRPAQEPNWVDKGTLLVLALTLIVVSFYTCEAHRQNDLAVRALDLNSRAYIQAVFPIGNCAIPQAGQKLKCTILLTNSGRVPADVHIRAIAVYSSGKITAPSLPSAETRQLIWPSTTDRGFESVWSPDVLTQGQVSDMQAGRGWLYLRALVSYGLYHTAICSQFSLVPGSDPSHWLSLEQVSACDDQAATDAN